MSLLNLSPKQLRLAARLKERVVVLENRLEQLLTGTVLGKSPVLRTVHKIHQKRRTMTRAAKTKLRTAAKTRLTKLRRRHNDLPLRPHAGRGRKTQLRTE